MSGTPSFKLSNVIGAPFKDYVQQQLKTRVQRSMQLQRTPNEIIYLANKLAWVKLSSSVNISDEYVTKLREYYEKTEDFGFEANNVVNENLAKNWVLQAGTSKQTTNPDNPLQENITLRSGLGLDGAYGLGGVKAQGYRPMPGLDSVTIESAGKLGSLRYANITFKVWNMNQLDVIDALYFRLGYTMLLEWGHVNYFKNDTTPRDLNNDGITDTPTLLGEFETSEGGISGFFKPEGVVKKEEVLRQINARTIETDGNYDGMLGVVTNFNYSFNQDGGWDCTLRLLGLGSIIETQKINTTYTMPPWSEKTWKRYVKIIEENVRKKKEKAARDEARIAQIEANAANKKLVQNFDKAQPFKNLETFYNSLSPAVPLTDNELSQNPTVMALLWNKVALTPFVINSADLNDTEVDAQLIPASAIRGAYINASGYITNNNLYAAHVRETAVPNLVASEAGWRYPVQSGATYALDYSLLGNLIAFGRYRKFKVDRPGVAYYTDARANEVLNTTNGLTALGEMLVDYTNLYTNARNGAPGSPFPNLKKLKTENGSGGSLVITAEDPSGLSSSTDTEIMVIYAPPIDIKIQYGQTAEYVQQKIENPGTPIFDTVVSFKIQALDAAEQVKIDDNYYWPNTSNFASQIRQTFSSYGQDIAWTVEEVTINYDKLKGSDNKRTSNYSPTSLFKDPALAKVKLTSVPFQIYPELAQSIQRGSRELPGTAVQNVGLTVTVTIETYVYSILRKLLTTASGATAPPGGAQTIKAQRVELTEAEKQQIQKVGGLSSALEAMLSIIQYEGVVNAIQGAVKQGQLSPFSVTETVADFLVNIENAPLKNIFSNNRTLRTSAELDDDIINASSLDLLTDPYFLGLKGYNTELMSYNRPKDKTITDKVFYDKYPRVEFEKLFQAYILYKELYASGTEVQSSLAILETPVYVKLGFLLFFINNLCLLYDSTKKGSKGSARPHFYIDYNPTTNLCLTAPSHLSVSPTTCLIPYKGDKNDYEKLFQAVNNKPPKNPDLDAKTSVTSILIPDFKGSNDYQARTMEILVNTQYLLDTIKQSVDRDNHNDVYFRPFLDRVLADLNKATGDINAFRLGYIDAGNVAAILDDQYVPPHQDDPNNNVVGTTNRGNAVLPLFGAASLARELTIETNISTKMSSMIAIAARGERNKGSTQSTDASNLHWLSEGLFDRVVEQADDIAKQQQPPPPSAPPNQQQAAPKGKTDNTQAVSDLFDGHIKSIYRSKIFRVNKSAIEPSTNFYIQALTKTKATDEVTRGTPIIPVNISFATDGIAGINMGNVFLVPNDRLPISLRGKNDSYRFGFMVMGLTHTIQSNQWVTSVKGQIIKLRPGENAELLTRKGSSQGAAPSSNQNQITPIKLNKKILLSAGHGGTDEGAKGNGYIERDLTIEQRSLIHAELLVLGVQSEDMLIDPDENSSGETANYAVRQGWNNADVILCDLHFNAGGGTGTVTYVPDYDAATGKGSSATTDLEISLAKALTEAITSVSGLPVRGGEERIASKAPQKTPAGVGLELLTNWVKGLGNQYLPIFYNLQNTTSVLIETCFIDSASDMQKYEAKKVTIAEAIAKTLVEYAQQ